MDMEKIGMRLKLVMCSNRFTTNFLERRLLKEYLKTGDILGLVETRALLFLEVYMKLKLLIFKRDFFGFMAKVMFKLSELFRKLFVIFLCQEGIQDKRAFEACPDNWPIKNVFENSYSEFLEFLDSYDILEELK